MTRTLVLISALVSSPSLWACRCDGTLTKGMWDGPKTAKAAFLATVKKVEQKKGKKTVTFTVERGWGAAKAGALVAEETGGDCELSFRPDGKYLVLSAVMPPDKMNLCNTVVIPGDKSSKMVEKLDAK